MEKMKSPRAAEHLGMSPAAFRHRCKNDSTFPKPLICGPRLNFFLRIELDQWLATRSKRPVSPQPSNNEVHP